MGTKRIKQGEKARDFTLVDTQGRQVSLSDFEGKQNVYLVFNRGFT
jgi:peroxiredoxin